MTMSSQPRPVVFLDFDDVVCLQDPYGGYEAFAALREIVVHGRPADEFSGLFAKLFNAACVENLREIHDRFLPRYVLSTSWTRLANRAALDYLMARTPLAFVAEHLHPAWETPKPAGRGANRRREIEEWLAANPAEAHQWVALDDDRSGAELAEWTSERSAIVLCEEGHGLTHQKAEQLSQALTLRTWHRTRP